MTQVAQNDRRKSYTATAGQTEFETDFPVSAADDLMVYVDGVSVSFTFDAASLTATLDTPATDGQSVVLEGLMPIERNDAFPTRGSLRSSQLNYNLNTLFEMLQELRRDVDRAVLQNKAAADGVSSLLPLPVPSTSIVWNDDGTALASGPTTTEISSAQESAIAAEASAGDAATSAAASAAAQTAAEVARDEAVAAIGQPADGSVTTTKMGGDVTDAGKALLISADAEGQRATLGLGAAAVEDVGTSTGDLVQLEDVSGSPGLPAIDGSQLTNLPSTSKVMRVAYVYAANTNGSQVSAVSTAWKTIAINTATLNEITGASLATNSVTLPSGTYEYEFWVYCQDKAGSGAATHGAIKLVNTADATDVGNAIQLGGQDRSMGAATQKGKFTIAASKTFELQFWPQTTDFVIGDYLGVLTYTGNVESIWIVFKKIA